MRSESFLGGVAAGVALCAVWLMLLNVRPASGDQIVTLTQRQFAASSPAAPFQTFLAEARRLAATTTPAWKSADDDLAAWGPALVFAHLDQSTGTSTVVDLAAPLETQGSAPLLMFRTLGLYAAKSRVPFADTPTLKAAVARNLRTIERATSDLDTFTGGPGLAGWGSIGAGAWLAYLELLYPDYFDLGDPGAERWGRDGVRIIDQLLIRGVLPDGKGWRRDPRDEQLTLWPNALAIYALVKAYENQEVVKYESAAIAAAAAVEALRAEDGSYYATAARSEKDPRANAYFAGALLLLFKDSGDAHYRDRALGILRWLTSAAAASVVTRDAALGAHVAYLAVLADSLAMQRFENLLGRRPMRVADGLSASASPVVGRLAGNLHAPRFRYGAMFDAVLATLLEHVPQAAGDLAYDDGDAPGYAVEVLLAGGERAEAAPIVEREERLVAWPRPRNVVEISFGAHALLAAEHFPLAADKTPANALCRYLLYSGILAVADRYYFDWFDWLAGGGFDYGPTVIGAQVAGTHLDDPSVCHESDCSGQPTTRPGVCGMLSWRLAGPLHPLQVAQSLLAGADRAAWDAARHVYRTRPEDVSVALLPNALMIIDLVDAPDVTAEHAYLTRAEEVASGLEVLWDDARGAYFATAEQMGDDGYEPLSGNSYAALAMLRLFRATRVAGYRERALRIFDFFINRDLYADGVIYHHLYRGRRAGGDVWCTGCNWRVLDALAELAREK